MRIRRQATAQKKRKYKKIILIPELMAAKIDQSTLLEKEKQKAKKMLDFVFQKWSQSGLLFNEAKEIPSSLLVAAFGGNYWKTWNQLQELNLIASDGSYSTSKKKCKSYVLNNDLIDQQFISKQYKKPHYRNIQDSPIQNTTRKILRSVRLSTRLHSAKSAIQYYGNSNDCVEHIKYNEKITETFLPNCKVSNDIIQRHSIIFDNGGLPYSFAIGVARKEGLDLIQDRRKFYIRDKKEFIRNKRIQIIYHAERSIIDIHNNKVRAHRNSTNNRLDTNLTNMSSWLIKHLRLDGERLVNIDLSNSQFRILAMLLEKNDQYDTLYDRFVTLAKNGTLYSFIASELQLKDDREAKRIMFEIFFSKRQNNTTEKTKIRNLFPGVVNMIDEFKKDNGDKTFAVMLQTVESELFINRILKKLLDKEYRVLSKHDSILCKISDLQPVMEIVKQELDKSFGADQYKLKIEN